MRRKAFIVRVAAVLAAAAPAGAATQYYSTPEPEGNYLVTVKLGAADRAAVTTIRAELRRLMAEAVPTAAGETKTVRLAVNVRTPPIAGTGTAVRLKPRERTGEIADWDDKLELEFDGDPAPAVRSVDVRPAGDLPTVYLAGDSTVCDQPYEPYASWGQMITRFLGPGVAIANHAESGESLRSFVGERRLAKLDTLMKPGDYLFIQFGHNDQKERGPGVGAMTTYKRDLETFVADARAHGAQPVLVTPVSRRTFGPDGRVHNSLGEFPAAVRAVANEQQVPLVDLNALSVKLYEALGAEGAKRLFPTVHGVLEGTHHNNYGSYEIARCVVEGIKAAKLPLAKFLRSDVKEFDPSKPDNPETFDVPASPKATSEVPYGN